MLYFFLLRPMNILFEKSWRLWWISPLSVEYKRIIYYIRQRNGKSNCSQGIIFILTVGAHIYVPGWNKLGEFR